MLPHSPLISVVIPTYNRGVLLKKAIESVVAQSYENIEIIIVDNNSTDNTDEVISSFVDSRIKVYKIHNQGIIAASRNLGIKNAEGDWIALLDSDDYWFPSRLEAVLKYTASPYQFDVISTDEIQLCSTTKKTSKLVYGPLRGNAYKNLLLLGNRLSPSSSLIKRAFLQENNLQISEDKNVNTVEDYDFWLNIALAGGKFKFIHSFEGVFLIHDKQTSDTEIHRINSAQLRKDHVFNKQNFESDKEKLWKILEAQVDFQELIRQCYETSFLSTYYQMIKAFVKNPVSLSRFLMNRTSRMAQNRVHILLDFLTGKSKGRISSADDSDKLSSV